MSEENLVRFMNKVTDSEELQAKIGEEIDGEALITLGAECGCEFTAEELQDFAVEYTTSEEWDTFPVVTRVSYGIRKLHCRNDLWWHLRLRIKYNQPLIYLRATRAHRITSMVLLGESAAVISLKAEQDRIGRADLGEHEPIRFKDGG